MSNFNNRNLSDEIQKIVNEIKRVIGSKFVSIHLRNGSDWVRACETLEKHKLKNYMASTQCGTPKIELTPTMCLQNITEIIKSIESEKIRKIFISTDYQSYENEISAAGFEVFTLKNFLSNIHIDEDLLPIIDLAVHTQSDVFFANCVSSFSSFAVRHRSNTGKITKFLALPNYQSHSEL